MTIALALRAIWSFLRPILVFGITLPVWAFLVAGAWLWFDKTSSVRQAVNKATAELVAGAQIEALNAQLVEERRIRAWSDGKAEEAARIAADERAARVDLEQQLTQTDADKKEMADELAAIAARPVPGDCRVDQQLLNSLRNR